MLDLQSEQSLNADAILAPLIPRLGPTGETGEALQAQPPLDEIIETAIAWASHHIGQAELVTARQEFFSQAGKAFHDDTFYDARISYFIEHFLFERPLGPSQAGGLAGEIPFQAFLRRAIEPSHSLSAAAKAAIASIAQPRHSLYSVEKIQEKAMYVRDLLTPQKFKLRAKAGESFRGFMKNDVFQAYVFRIGGYCLIGSGLIIHPQKANRTIHKSIRLAKKSHSLSEIRLLWHFAHQQIRHLRHRHVDPRQIYQTTLPH